MTSHYGKKKIHTACGQSWTDHTVSMGAGGKLLWVCPLAGRQSRTEPPKKNRQK